MNIVSAVLAFTRLDYRIRAALLAIPTLSLVIAPLVLIIPNAQHFTDRSYFTVLQAIYRLLRFTTPQLLVTVLVVSLLCFALNLFALILIFRDKSESIDEMPKETRKAYVALACILSLATVVSLISGASAAQSRALDRQACANYAALAVPETDEGVPVFLSDIQLYGEAAGTDQVKTPMVTFAEKSRQYYTLYYSDEETNVDLDALLEEVKAAKDQIAQVCTEYSVD
jgi:Co/Zn/Cd efflux system component